MHEQCQICRENFHRIRHLKFIYVFFNSQENHVQGCLQRWNKCSLSSQLFSPSYDNSMNSMGTVFCHVIFYTKKLYISSFKTQSYVKLNTVNLLHFCLQTTSDIFKFSCFNYVEWQKRKNSRYEDSKNNFFFLQKY